MGGHDGRLRQGPQVQRQRLPAAGGQGDAGLALVGRLRVLVREGVPQLRPVQPDGDLHSGGLEDQKVAVGLALRQGHGEAVELPLPQLRGEAGGVKGRLPAGGGHHRPGRPGGVDEARLRLGEPLEKQHHPGAQGQKGQGAPPAHPLCSSILSHGSPPPFAARPPRPAGKCGAIRSYCTAPGAAPQARVCRPCANDTICRRNDTPGRSRLCYNDRQESAVLVPAGAASDGRGDAPPLPSGSPGGEEPSGRGPGR